MDFNKIVNDHAETQRKVAPPEVPLRSSYEGNGGWTDGRLGQAYDLVEAVQREQHTEHESHRMLRDILGQIEDADIELGATK